MSAGRSRPRAFGRTSSSAAAEPPEIVKTQISAALLARPVGFARPIVAVPMLTAAKARQLALQAPIMDIGRNPVAGDHRLDVDEDPARCESAKQAVPSGGAEHPVRHGEDNAVELGETLQR